MAERSPMLWEEPGLTGGCMLFGDGPGTRRPGRRRLSAALSIGLTAIKSESEGRTAWLDTNGSHGVTQRCAPFSWRCRALPSMAAKRDKAVAHFVPPATDPTARGTDMLDMAI